MIERIEKIAEKHGYLKQLRHRLYYLFGCFLQDMVNYLVFGELSTDEEIREFQKTIDREKCDPEDFNTYLDLFEKYMEFGLNDLNKTIS